MSGFAPNPEWIRKVTYELIGFNTDSRYRDDVRHREYTTSAAKADEFEKIPRIQFTDSGHGIVFQAREMAPGERRKEKRRMSYVDEQLAIIRTRKTREGAIALRVLEKKIKDYEDGYKRLRVEIEDHKRRARVAADRINDLADKVESGIVRYRP